MVEPFVIGICGGSASGKTTVAQKIITELGVPWVTLLSMDSFYIVLSQEQHEAAGRNEHNFDHPDAFDFDLLVDTLRRLKEGKKVDVPIYNFVTHRSEEEGITGEIVNNNLIAQPGEQDHVDVRRQRPRLRGHPGVPQG